MSHTNQAAIGEWVENEDQAIAAKLFRLRARLGVERKELAEFAGIEEQELASYEKGIEPIPASMLAIFAIILGVRTEYFFSEDSEQVSSEVAGQASEKENFLVS